MSDPTVRTVDPTTVVLPLLVLILAAGSAAVLAYGTHPALGQYAHGLAFILLARRSQWVLVALCLGLVVVLLALIVSGRRRAWWLIGLGPILALFIHAFATGPMRGFSVVENPPLLPAEKAASIADDDSVVGIVLDHAAYAYPYAELYPAPAVIQSDRGKRFLLLWSAFANRATAFSVSRDFKARDLEIVSMPRSALLVYNTRVGQFINGVTGLTPDGKTPTGLHTPLETHKMTWKAWRMLHPDTQVATSASATSPRGPTTRLSPLDRSTPGNGTSVALNAPPDQRIVFIPTTRPVATPTSSIPGAPAPANLPGGDVPVLLFRDPLTGLVRAFSRRLDDLSPRFRPNTNPKWKDAAFIDVDTRSGWTLKGLAIEGAAEMKGRRLSPLPADEDVYWSVMKFWYPSLQLQTPDVPSAAPERAEPESKKPIRSRRPRPASKK